MPGYTGECPNNELLQQSPRATLSCGPFHCVIMYLYAEGASEYLQLTFYNNAGFHVRQYFVCQVSNQNIRVTERNSGGFFFQCEAYVEGCLDPKPSTSSCLSYVIFFLSLYTVQCFQIAWQQTFLWLSLVSDDFIICPFPFWYFVQFISFSGVLLMKFLLQMVLVGFVV